MDTIHRLRTGIETGLQLVAVSGVCWPLSLLATVGLGGLIGVQSTVGLLGLACAIGGVAIGFAQHLVLPYSSKGSARWVAATAVGWVVGWLTAAAIIETSSLVGLWAIAGSAGGLLYGGIQSLALHARLRTKGVWWAASSAVWAVAYGMGSLPLRAVPGSFGLATVAALGTFGWTVLGMVAVALLITLMPKANLRDPGTPVRWWP